MTSNQINIDGLKTMITNKIKEIGLNDVLDSAAVEKIKDRVMNAYNHDKAKSSLPDMIPEAVVPNGMGQSETGIFPNGGFGTGEPTGRTSMDDTTSVEKIHIPGDYTQQPGQNIDASTTGNIPAYKPELPSFMDKIEPAKLIVFSQNELSEGGENLSNKPFRTYENPDMKKSMSELWMDKGQKKADVYMVKLEKIGCLEFDYANGTTKFVEKRFDPDFESQAKYKENPYMADNAIPAIPGALDINGQPNIMVQIANSIDLEKVISDIVKNILMNNLLYNNTKAVNSNLETPSMVVKNKVTEMSPEEPNGYSVASSVKPMEESFSLKMIDLINEYEKIDAPNKLKEAIKKNDKNFLIKENGEVQEWAIEGKTFYTPVNKISTRKCYIKY